jgi:hypothetical protein
VDGGEWVVDMVGTPYRDNDRADVVPTSSLVKFSLLGAIKAEVPANANPVSVFAALVVGVALYAALRVFGIDWLGPLFLIPGMLRVWRRVRGRWWL